jgi:hypothetical protein
MHRACGEFLQHVMDTVWAQLRERVVQITGRVTQSDVNRSGRKHVASIHSICQRDDRHPCLRVARHDGMMNWSSPAPTREQRTMQIDCKSIGQQGRREFLTKCNDHPRICLG